MPLNGADDADSQCWMPGQCVRNSRERYPAFAACSPFHEAGSGCLCHPTCSAAAGGPELVAELGEASADALGEHDRQVGSAGALEAQPLVSRDSSSGQC